jgi:hypothetical protein
MLKHLPTIQTVAFLLGWSRDRMETAKAVLAFADRLSETRGDPNTVIYLKESLRLLQKAIAGQPERKAAGPLRIGIDRLVSEGVTFGNPAPGP